MSTILVTGAAGFLGGYLVDELLRQGHRVVGLDNLSKYGRITRSFEHEPTYTFVEGDARDVDLMQELLVGVDHLVAGAALSGGTAYFHEFPYDILAQNERIITATCDAAIRAHDQGRLQKVTYISSSMVFEGADFWPSAEGDELRVPAPRSSYGFQKLSVEYFARAAWDQHRLPFTIVRPSNCVGIGEVRAIDAQKISTSNIKLAMSHVVPDLVQKIVKGQEPLRILGSGNQVRHFTYGGDLAKGIVTCITHPAAVGDDFNLTTSQATTVLELAQNVWRRINPDRPFAFLRDPPYEHDVQKQMISAVKAEKVLGFTCRTTLDQMLDIVVPWIVQAVDDGLI